MGSVLFPPIMEVSSSLYHKTTYMYVFRCSDSFVIALGFVKFPILLLYNNILRHETYSFDVCKTIDESNIQYLTSVN